MEYFCISDIHGYFTPMIESLNNHGYDSSNPNHHLIVIGDMFDRGPNSKQVLEYLYPLAIQNKATVILGNHDSFLLDFLEANFERAYFNMLYNGFGATLYSLTGIEPREETFEQIREYILGEYDYLYPWLSSLPLFLELGDYIFVHGGIDGGKLDWKSMSSQHDFIWSQEYDLPKVEGKTVVAGHTRVATLRQRATDYHMLYLYHPEYFDILYEDGKILIDRYVEVSQELNVLKLLIKT